MSTALYLSNQSWRHEFFFVIVFKVSVNAATVLLFEETASIDGGPNTWLLIDVPRWKVSGFDEIFLWSVLGIEPFVVYIAH